MTTDNRQSEGLRRLDTVTIGDDGRVYFPNDFLEEAGLKRGDLLERRLIKAPGDRHFMIVLQPKEER